MASRARRVALAGVAALAILLLLAPPVLAGPRPGERYDGRSATGQRVYLSVRADGSRLERYSFVVRTRCSDGRRRVQGLIQRGERPVAIDTAGSFSHRSPAHRGRYGRGRGRLRLSFSGTFDAAGDTATGTIDATFSARRFDCSSGPVGFTVHRDGTAGAARGRPPPPPPAPPAAGGGGGAPRRPGDRHLPDEPPLLGQFPERPGLTSSAAGSLAAVIGVLLAGGANDRLGRGPKPAALLGGRPLASYPVEAPAGVCDRVGGVCKRSTQLPELPGTERWDEPDEPRHPITGIVHALETAGAPVLVCAADMPFVTADACRTLLSATGSTPAVVATGAGVLQPALGLYAPAALDVLKAAPEGAPLTRTVESLQPARVALPPALLRSVDTLDDLAEAEAVLAASP